MTSKPLKELLEEDEHGFLPINSMWKMAHRLSKLDKRHRSYSQHVSGTIHCLCGAEDPCPDRRILDGEDE